MELFITGLHITLCFFLILVVLLQPGKGADFGAAMGGSSQEVFGAGGSITILTKLTVIVAAMIMSTSLALAWFSNDMSGGSEIGMDQMDEELQKDAAPDPEAESELPPADSSEESPATDAPEGVEGDTTEPEPAAETEPTGEASGDESEASGAGEEAAEPEQAEPSQEGGEEAAPAEPEPSPEETQPADSSEAESSPE